MRVLLVHCFYRSAAPSGEDSVYRNEKKLLEDNGYEVITYEKFNDNLDNSSTLKKLSAGIEFVWSPTAFREITSIIEKYKPDIAHFHNIFPQISSSAYAACKQFKVPVVQTLHNFRYICPGGLLQRNSKPCEKCIDVSLLSSLVHKCYRNSFVATLPMATMIYFNRLSGNFSNNVDRYIALTEFGKARFAMGGLPQHKIAVKPNFVTDTFNENGNEAGNEERSGESSTLGDYVLYVGRLTQEKGVITLINACKQTKEIPLKVLGDGELRAQLESLCIQFNLNVEFLGYQNKDTVISMLKKSRFLVLPSECYEGFPVTVAEAYSCGKPVLGSKIGSLDEIIIENVTGRKFAFGSENSLAERMRWMWSDTMGLEQMSKNARAIFEEKYNPEKNLHLLRNIYNDAIDENLNRQDSSH
jgi:glycosyltransferase involved in cell wall biosynthesis